MLRKAARRASCAIALGTCAGLAAPPVQADPCVVVSSRINLTSGTCEVTPGTELRATNTNPAVSAANTGTLIDLRPGATVITSTTLTRNAIGMTNGGQVLMGPLTLIRLDASGLGVLGISVSNSRFTAPLGTGIPLQMHNATTGNNVSGYGVRAVQGSDMTLGLDLTSDFSRSAYGVRADTESRVVLIDSSTIALTGPDSGPGGAALMAVDAGSIIDARNGTRVANSGHDVTGLYLSNGGLVLADASTQLTLGTPASQNAGTAGIVADNTRVPAGTVDGALLIFSGIAGTGITATRGADLVASGMRVQGAGMGVVADTGSRVAISASQLDISDTHGGIVRTIEPSGATFGTTFLRQGAGLFALGGKLDADQVSIRVSADGAYGAYASHSVLSPATMGTLHFANGTIDTSGVGAYGAVATGSPFVDGAPVLTLQTASVTTRNTGAHALAVISGGVLAANDSMVRAEGLGAAGLFSSTASATRSNTASLSGGSLMSTQGPAIQVAGSRLDLTLTDGAEVGSGSGTLFTVEGDGARSGGLYLAATASTMDGAALTAPGSYSEMQLQEASRWTVTGSSVLSRLVNSAGDIVFNAPGGPAEQLTSYKTLTVGEYVGEGGAVTLTTWLAGDGSPSDRLVINGGAAIGQTGLIILRSGGDGALTTGDGILLVDVQGGATTSAGAFALLQRVVEGPYEYQLVRGDAAASRPGAWFLSSQRMPTDPSPELPPQPPTPPNPPLPPVPPVPPVPPAPPGTPEPPAPPPAVPEAPSSEIRPLYRPEVAAYLANQRQAATLFVHSLHDRLGEAGWPGGGNADDEATRPSAWIRVVGRDGRSRSRDGVFDVNTDASLVQMGGDVAHWRPGDGQGMLHLGGMLGYGSASNDASAAGNPAHARGRTEGWSLGGYITWYARAPGTEGPYLDGWVLHGRNRTTVQGDGLPDVRHDARTWTLSAEAGYALRLGQESGWWLEPQLQLGHLRLDETDSIEVNGTRVAGIDGNGWTSRLGVRTHRTWLSAGSRFQPYLTANWWRDRIPDRMAFNGIPLGELYPRDRYELKLGVNAWLGPAWSAWANVGYQRGGQSYSEVLLRAGARYRW